MSQSGLARTSATRHYTERTVDVRTADGIACNVINVRGPVAPTRPPVLFVHGAGVRANIFRAPVETSFVDFLIERGHDVWLENWRASIDVAPNEWTLDDAAVHEHPAVVQTVVRETGVDSINAVIFTVGLIASLLFFYYSREHKGALGAASKLGIIFLMVSFGAGYGYTVMSRVSLLIGRFLFLVEDWLGLR